MNVLDFLVNTYEEDITKSPHRSNVGDSNINDDRVCRQRGRQPNERIRYLAQHPNYAKKTRVVCSKRHRSLPNFIGQYFPQRDNSKPMSHVFYCASMLMLLKPWRNV